MNLLFDEDSQKLIVMAKNEMFNLKHPYVGSEHLFLAILKCTNLKITKLLNKYGINYDDYRNEIISIIGVGNQSNNWFLFTPLLKRIINNATYYSTNSSKKITPHSLLISILQEGDGVANRILVGMNVDLEALYDKFISEQNIFIGEQHLLIDDLGVNMIDNAKKGKYDPVVGRDLQVERLINILLRKNKNNPLLIGEAGVGKTAIVEELSRRIARGNVPEKLKNKKIYSISMSVLVSGTKYRGEFEEKIHNIIKEVINNQNIVLFIDEIHTLVGAGGAEGAIDASNIIKPYLARGDFQVIGATTNLEYTSSFATDKALDRRFQKIYIFEPTENETIDIIRNLKSTYETFHDILIPNELIIDFVTLSNRYLKYGSQPDKAIDLLDEASTYCASIANICDRKLRDLEEKIKIKEQEKNIAILSRAFKKAMICREEELNLRSQYDSLMYSSQSISRKNKLKLDDIYKIISDKTGIFFGNEFANKLSRVKIELQKVCYGKNKEINSIINFLKKNYFSNYELPISFLLVGKSGVGKTFLVEEFAKNICFSDAFVNINICEYITEFSLNKWIKVSDNILNKIKLHPFSVFLIKNIDLSNNNIYDFLLSILTSGYVSNSQGEKIYFSNAIIFFTIPDKNYELGFNNTSNNDYFNLYDKISKIIEFKNVTKNDILKVLSEYNDVSDFNLNDFWQEIDYKNFGYKKLESCLKKYMIDMK